MTGPDRVERALPRALRLVTAVRYDGAGEVQKLLAGADLQALAIALAALVPDDVAPADLLAWHHDPAPAPTEAPLSDAQHEQLERTRAASLAARRTRSTP